MHTEHSSTKTGNAGAKVDQKVAQASTATHDTIDRAASKARPAVDNLAEGAHETVDRLAGAASQAAYRLEEKGEEFREIQQEALTQLRAYVNEHPVAALSMAVAGGFLLSKIFSSR